MFYTALILLVALNAPAYAQDLFGPKTDYYVGFDPRWLFGISVFSADLDGDGDNDIAVTNVSGVSVLLNNGNGTFATKVDYSVADIPTSIFSADLDSDGDNDLAVTNVFSANASVLLNNGDGTFATKVDYAVERLPESIFSADLDGDGDNDLAVANAGLYPSFIGTVTVLLNNGNGTFARKLNYPAGINPASVFSADLDGDGDNDLAVANRGAFHSGLKEYINSSVSVLLNNGDGTFASKIEYTGGDSPTSVLSDDLDGDGDNDLAVTNQFSYNISVLLNSGNGTFAPKVDYGVGVAPFSLFSADLDGDGDNDLAVTNRGYADQLGNTVSVLLNNGDGTFAPHLNYRTGNMPASVFSADLNGDGNNDLGVANSYSSSVSVLLNLSSHNIDSTGQVVLVSNSLGFSDEEKAFYEIDGIRFLEQQAFTLYREINEDTSEHGVFTPGGITSGIKQQKFQDFLLPYSLYIQTYLLNFFVDRRSADEQQRNENLLQTTIIESGELTIDSKKFADTVKYYNTHGLNLSEGQKVTLSVEPSSIL